MPFDFEIFDAHCDSLTRKGDNLGTFMGEFSVKGAEEYASFIQVAAIITDRVLHKPWERTCFHIEKIHNSTGFNFIKCKEDFDKKGVGIILGIEGGESIEGDISRMEQLFNSGVRVFGLTWNTPGDISGTAVGGGGGLTPFGRQVVKEAERLGMVIDVSHISEQGFYDVAIMAEKPFIASHSNSKALCNHPRNLTDDQFKAIIKAGGVAGVNYYTDFLGDFKGIDGIIAHIEHFMSLGGEENIGIGADLDGGITLPDGIEGVKDHYKVLNALLQRNYSEKQVQNIAINNFKRVFFNILPEKCCIL